MAAFYSKLLTRMQRPGPRAPDPERERDERDAFAQRVRGTLATLGIGADYDPDGFALRLPMGQVTWLGNRFDEYLRAGPEDRDALVMHAVQGIVEASRDRGVAADPDEAFPRLRPRIRLRAQQVILRLQLELDGLDPTQAMRAFVPITDDLGVEVVFDTPTNLVSLPAERLDRWGLSPAAALRIATDNLRASAPAPFRPVGDGVFAAAVGDCYDSARLLLIDEIARLPVAGETVALPANRDTLLITGSQDLGGLYRLLQAALEAVDRPRMDTLQPVVLRDGAWVDWTPEPDHPMAEPFHELAVRTRGTSYAEVQALLELRNERDRHDLFVASFGLLRLAEGAPPASHAVWPAVRGWLPESELVSVISPDETRYVVVRREDLMACAGHLLDRVPGLHPPYRAFDGPPDERVWARLRERALGEAPTGV